MTFLVGTKRCSSIISVEAATAGDGRQKMKMGKKRSILSRTPGAGVASKNLSVGGTRNNSKFCSFTFHLLEKEHKEQNINLTNNEHSGTV